MREVGRVVVQQPVVVRDDQDAHLRAADLGNALAGQLHGVHVEAAVGLVEDRKLRPQHGQLQNLGPLHLAAREAVVHVAAGKLLVHSQLAHFLLKLLAKLSHRDQLFAFLAVGIADVRSRVSQEVGHFHARNRHRTLEGHEDPGPRPLRRIPFENVLAVELDRAVGDFVFRVTHDRAGERALAGAVRPHQRVRFAAADRQIHAVEDRFALDGHVQVVDLKRFGHYSCG